MHNDSSIFNHHSMPAAAYYLGCSPIVPYSASRTGQRTALRRTNSLASMLPSLLSSLLMAGLVTLVMAAVLRLVWVGFSADFTTAWMEAWLTSWLIAFPLVYLFNKPVTRLAALIARPTVTLEAERDANLSVSQIAEASANATALNGLRVQRQPDAVIAGF